MGYYILKKMNVELDLQDFIPFIEKQGHHIILMVISVDMSQIEKYEQLGLNIAYYRRKRKYTQEQLAEKVGVDRTHMGNIEQDRSGASLDVVFRLADALEVPVSRLFECRDGTDRKTAPTWGGFFMRYQL